MASSCSICLSTTAECADKEWCVLSKCGHTFHAECLSQACANNPRCPNCREGICLSQSDRDCSVLRRNLVLPIRLDLGQDDGSQSQLSLSPASDRLKRQLAAAQSECRTLEEQLQQKESTSRQQLEQMQLQLSRSEQVLQVTQDKLAAAREEVHTQKRQFTAQLKDERSQRRTAEILAERLQAAVDKYQLSADTLLSRSELVQIAMRHGKAARDANMFADTIRARDERNQQVLCDKEREAARSEQQLRRSEQQLADRDAAIARLQAQLRAAEAQQQAAAHTASAAEAAAAAVPAATQPDNTPCHSQSSKALGGKAAAQLAAEDEWLELDDEEEAGVETPLEAQRPRPPLQPRQVHQNVQGGGGHISFLNALAPRGLAEPSFMHGATNTSTSGTFIREGPDGRGGRTKVLKPSSQPWMAAAHQKRLRTQAAAAPVPAIKRYKGPSARGGAAITIQHFFDAAEQDAGGGEQDKPAQQRGH